MRLLHAKGSLVDLDGTADWGCAGWFLILAMT